MNRLQIVHTVSVRFGDDVASSHTEVRMLASAQVDVSPDASETSYDDYWGARVTEFAVTVPHREITVSATALVDTSIAGTAADDPAMRIVEYAEPTGLTDAPTDLRTFAARTSGVSASVDDAAVSICRQIGAAMRHATSTVAPTAALAWSKRRGSGSDIAHVAIAALRSAGIPARYVYGYRHPHLEPEIGETVVGDVHAWVEWSTDRWHAYDPSDLCPASGSRYIAVARGRDGDDVSPVRVVSVSDDPHRITSSVELTAKD